MRRLALVLFLLPALALAAPADLDPAFATLGLKFGDYAGPTERHFALRAVGAVGNGYTALVERDVGGTPQLVMVRLDAQGNETGAVALAFATPLVTQAHVYPDGRVLITSILFVDAATAVARIDRLLPSGAPDPSFGGGDGVVGVQEDGFGLVPTALDVTATGEIAIAGYRRVLAEPDDTAQTFVARLSPAGEPVASFAGGVAHLDVIPFEADFPQAVALAPAGTVYVCDSGNFAGQSDALLTRLRSSGVLDTPYASSGTLYYDTSPPKGENFYDFCEDIDVQPLTGATVMTVRRADLTTRAVRRVPVDSAGNAGAAFDNVVTPAIADAALAFDAQGRSVLAVTSVRAGSIDVDLVRFAPAGNADATFGLGGTICHVVPQPPGAQYASLEIASPLVRYDARGRILVGATVREDEDEAAGWALMRLMGDAAFADGFE